MPRRRFSRLPKHVGLIPDGNRRWARQRGLPPEEGYAEGVTQGLKMLVECLDLGIQEVSVYGFTQDNTKRPREQRLAFSAACQAFAEHALKRDVRLCIIGDVCSDMFPEALKMLANEPPPGDRLKVNMLVNYGWEWDIRHALDAAALGGDQKLMSSIASAHVSRIDLIVRWGGCRRLSGFLPLQSVYSDFFVVEQYWPDYEQEQFYRALDWYQSQDQTLGG